MAGRPPPISVAGQYAVISCFGAGRFSRSAGARSGGQFFGCGAGFSGEMRRRVLAPPAAGNILFYQGGFFRAGFFFYRRSAGAARGGKYPFLSRGIFRQISSIAMDSAATTGAFRGEISFFFKGVFFSRGAKFFRPLLVPPASGNIPFYQAGFFRARQLFFSRRAGAGRRRANPFLSRGLFRAVFGPRAEFRPVLAPAAGAQSRFCAWGFFGKFRGFSASFGEFFYSLI